MSMIDPKLRFVANKLITPPLPLFADEFPILFFWSPKCGCTSLVKWYLYQIGLLEKALNYDVNIHTYRLNVIHKQKNHTLKIRKHLLHESKDVYKLVRNPYTRAVSSFFHTVRSEDLLNIIAPGMEDGLSFKQFLYRIKGFGVERGKINGHMVQQYLDGEELFVQNYIELENFSTSIRQIEKSYNLLQSPLNDIIKSPHHVTQKMDENDSRIFANTKMSIASFNQSLPPYKNFYDQETMELVREIYKMDFIKYGYNQKMIS
ncbi:sulfotransferase family 2 domain-containing protein [Alkalihalobacillus sp. TS-13]|uniref:sulfotransferase family 2 domain-containing protein n=1 Tax=Alkalihalobacillus sp. TS-13 TaxID=2842455 RepID=UPI001C8843F9|nr:sulfotransferase family 2 domain-containing protein [Alkalihalobacillus sp. TS-13]